MYAAGAESRFKKPCVTFLEKIAKSHSAHEYCTNTEVLQEILHRYKNIDLPKIGFEIFDLILNLGIIIHSIDLTTLKLARRILDEYDIPTRDSVHLGTIEQYNLKVIATYDSDFENYPALRVFKPK